MYIARKNQIKNKTDKGITAGLIAVYGLLTYLGLLLTDNITTMHLALPITLISASILTYLVAILAESIVNDLYKDTYE